MLWAGFALRRLWGFSAAVVNFTNKALSSAAPGFNDVMRQSPELMKTFTQATAQAMGQQSPGFQFMNDMMKQEPQVNTSFGPPPVPMQTKLQPPSQRGVSVGSAMNFTSVSSRPDLAAGRNTMFHEDGIDVSHPQENLTRQETSYVPRNASQTPRPEMRGPRGEVDVNQLLSGLKPQPQTQAREVNMYHDANVSNAANAASFSSIIPEDNDSMISAHSARSLSQNGGNRPKRTYRRKSSEKNSISLDI